MLLASGARRLLRQVVLLHGHFGCIYSQHVMIDVPIHGRCCISV